MMLVDKREVNGRPIKRWTVAEYDQGVALGSFRRDRVYLYRGYLYVEPVANEGQFGVRHRSASWLSATAAPDLYRSSGCSFASLGVSVTYPDAVVTTADQAASRPHLQEALLAVEISDDELDAKRQFADDYAASGVPEFWFINLQEHQIEVYRRSLANPASPTGHRYADGIIVKAGKSVASLIRPDASVSFAELMVGD